MSPELLPAIAAFARVAHHASFTRAAAELGVSTSALSQTVRMLEGRFGVRLLDRTTRRVGLTELGQHFLTRAQPHLDALDTAIAGLDEARDRPAGLLRLNLSRVAADMLVLPHLADFTAAYPDIRLEFKCENRLVDLVADGFDAGIRLGDSLALDVVAVPLGGTQRLVTFASPAYLSTHPAPSRPEELRGHRCLSLRLSSGGAYRWEYEHDARAFEIEIAGPLVCNDNGVLIGAALAGVGIGCAFMDEVRADFAAGTLVPLLESWWPSFAGFHLYHPSRAQVPRKLRVFIDFFRERLAATLPRKAARKQPLKR